MTRPQPFITCVRIERGDGPHEYVSVWIRGANVGTLCVGKGEGEPLALILQGCRCPPGFLDRHAVHALGCPIPQLGDRVAFQAAPDDDPLEPAPEIAARIMSSLDAESRGVLAELVSTWPARLREPSDTLPCSRCGTPHLGLYCPRCAPESRL